MSIQVILLPLFVQVALTFVLLFWMGLSRVGAIRRKETRISDVALGQLNWPIKVQQISNCFANQFQLPVLFYALVALALLIKAHVSRVCCTPISMPAAMSYAIASMCSRSAR